MLRVLTAGESHGEMLVGIMEGMPAGVPLDETAIDANLRRRQGGYGRGGRQRIERDHARIVAGVRNGETLGSPIAILIENRDWKNWQGVMNADPRDIDPERMERRAVTAPRPGHADLAGGLKYDRRDLRDVLERASARETAMRVALGSVAGALLRELGVRVAGHVVAIGGERAPEESLAGLSLADIAERAGRSSVYCADERASEAMVAAIRDAMKRNDTLGGEVEVRADGLPVGIGSHVDPARRLDARLAGALMGIQAVKGVEVGLGFRGAALPGSRVHDPIRYEPGAATARAGGYVRSSNGAGGLEGGITNGAELVVRVAMKPLSTLTHPLPSVDVRTKEATGAAVERTDVTAVPALSVVAEAVVALVLADAFLEKFGGDSLAEIRRNLAGYVEQVNRHPLPPAIPAGSPNLVLIGLPGAGKSAVAAAVARDTGRPAVDTDDLVARRTGRSVEAIFHESGEAAFREAERRAVEEVRPGAGLVVATGGGAPVSADNRKHLKNGAVVVWLDGTPETLAERLRASGRARPLLQGDLAEGLARLREARAEVYAEMADAVVPVDGRDVEAVAAEVAALWRAAAAGRPAP